VGLSGEERDRLVVLRQVKAGKLTQRKAAEQLGLSPRWVKKLMKRLKKEGDGGLGLALAMPRYAWPHFQRPQRADRQRRPALRRQPLRRRLRINLK
jgi:hypothetical protein